jgi:chromosome partitioning protein
MARLLDTVSMVRAQLNPTLVVSGILFCQYETAARLSGEVSYEVEKFLGEARGTDVPWANARAFETTIRRNIKLAEAPSFGKSILDYAPASAGAADYSVLADEVLKMDPYGAAVAPPPATPSADTPKKTAPGKRPAP